MEFAISTSIILGLIIMIAMGLAFAASAASFPSHNETGYWD